MKNDIDYEKDFYAWAIRQSELLRSHNLAEADIEHIAEEIVTEPDAQHFGSFIVLCYSRPLVPCEPA